MDLYFDFAIQASVSYAVFYGLWWRFKLRPAPAAWWVHAIVLAVLSLQGAVWRLAANMGGAPATGSVTALFIDLFLPAGLAFGAAWLLRQGMLMRMRAAEGQPSGANPWAIAALVVGVAVGAVFLAFTALVIGVGMSGGFRTPDSASAAVPAAEPGPWQRPWQEAPRANHFDQFDSPGNPGPSLPAQSLPNGGIVDPFRTEGAPAPVARADLEQEWSLAALAWERANPGFLADEARTQAFQEATDRIDRESGYQLAAWELLQRAEADAFQQTGWKAELARREAQCAAAYGRRLRALDGLPLDEFAPKHDRIVAERAQCRQAAR